MSMAVFGASYSCVCQHFIFAEYARRWPVASGMPRAQKLRSAVMTVVVHQIFTYPCLYFPSFFLITEIVRGRSMTQARERFEAHFWPNYKVGLIAWTPAMFVQFFYVPLPLQVQWIAGCSLCWNTFLSWRAL